MDRGTQGGGRRGAQSVTAPKAKRIKDERHPVAVWIRLLNALRAADVLWRSSGELAERIGVATSEASSTLRKLERQGHVVRGEKRGQGREGGALWALTSSGRRLVEEKRDLVEGFLHRGE